MRPITWVLGNEEPPLPPPPAIVLGGWGPSGAEVLMAVPWKPACPQGQQFHLVPQTPTTGRSSAAHTQALGKMQRGGSLQWTMFAGELGSSRAGGYSDPLELALLGEGEPRATRVSILSHSGNPVEGAKFCRGQGLGKGRCRDRGRSVSVGSRPRKNWGLMGSPLEAAWNRFEQGEGGCFGMMCLPQDNALILDFA